MIGHYKYVLHNGIRDIDALDLQEKLIFPPFPLKSKLICESRQTLILIINSISLVIGHYNHDLHIGMHDIDASDL